MSEMTIRRSRRCGGGAGAMGAVLALGMLAAGCGASAATAPHPSPEAVATSAGEPEATPVAPVTLTDATGRSVTVASVARIIPLDGDLAEIVFGLGLGDRVVATDLSATYPPEADAKPEIGYQRSLSAEPVLSFSPTVLLATPTAGPAEVIDQLRAAVPVVLIDVPDTLDGPAAKIRAVARALGVPGRGEVLAQKTQAEIDTARSLVPTSGARPRVAALYLRGDRVQHIFGPGSGIHAALTALGVVDVGEELGIKDSQTITTEAMVVARPDVLIVTTTGLESVGGAAELLAMPAFSRTPVATTRRVLAFEDQYLYGFGPRTGQLLTELVTAIYAP